MIGSTEIIIIVGVVMILFGARAIPKFARSLGQAKQEFEKGVRKGEAGEAEEDDEPETRDRADSSSPDSAPPRK